MRPGKVPVVGYQLDFPKSGKPFIYYSAAGTHEDLWVMLHESGHAFHFLAASAAQDLYWNRYPGTEFAELASQTMELLGLPYLAKDQGGFYSREEMARVYEEQHTRVLEFFASALIQERFDHWLYTDAPAEVTVAEVDNNWLALNKRLSPVTDWGGLESVRAKGWQTAHVFLFPFDSFSYARAYLGALQVWHNALEDRPGALARYRAALALGGSRPLPKLFKAAGASFAMDRATVARLATAV